MKRKPVKEHKDRHNKEVNFMVVQHNLTAMNSNRMLGITTKTQAKSTEKLSSGYKINRAADDAAGLSISEKMRKQIRGLTQASLNAQDGISAVQTAEGALNEVQDMLQRMNELAVKSATGTNSEKDRKYIQDEIDQLTTEIDRVAETTKFNETYLLKGTDKKATLAAAYTSADLGAGITASIAKGVSVGEQDIVLGTIAYQASTTAGEGIKANGTKVSGVSIDSTKFDKALMGEYTYAADSIDTDGDGTGDTDGWTAGGVAYTKEQLADLGINVGTATSNFTVEKGFTATTSNKLPAGITTTLPTAQADLDALDIGDLKATLKVGSDTTATIVAYDKSYVPEALELDLHVGADSTANNKISLSIDSMSAKAIGVADLKVDGEDSTNADAAIDTIANAIQKVSTQRSALGAVQNRLEHTINNLDNVVENTTSAEAQIRDTDMATEMVKYSNNQILAQAGQAMLAQSNQANQGVLSLLQ